MRCPYCNRKLPVHAAYIGGGFAPIGGFGLPFMGWGWGFGAHYGWGYHPWPGWRWRPWWPGRRLP